MGALTTAWARTPSGYEVPLRFQDAVRPRASVLLLPALGVAARRYDTLATALHERNISAATMEQRGHGDSAVRPSGRIDFGWKEMLLEDIPAALRAARERSPGVPCLLAGHSLGGHLATMTAGLRPRELDGLLLLACGSPWFEAYRPRTRLQVRLLCALMPAMCGALGYFPGQRFGFGGREARTAMADWCALARTNRFAARGLDADLEHAVRQYEGQVLVLRMEDDPYAPPDAVAAVTGKLANARLHGDVLTSAELGGRADHFRWMRCPRPVAVRVDDWLRTLPTANRGPSG